MEFSDSGRTEFLSSAVAPRRLKLQWYDLHWTDNHKAAKPIDKSASDPLMQCQRRLRLPVSSMATAVSIRPIPVTSLGHLLCLPVTDVRASKVVS